MTQGLCSEYIVIKILELSDYMFLVLKKIIALFAGKKDQAKSGEEDGDKTSTPVSHMEKTLPPVNETEKKKKKQKKKMKKRTVANKNGIRILSGQEDLYELFGAEEPEKIGNPEKTEWEKTGKSEFPKAPARKLDKNGLPVFDEQDNFFVLFDVDESEPGTVPHKIKPADKFAGMLERSLEGKSMDDLLREKGQTGKTKRVGIKQRIKKYPPPQGQLDLHGCNGVQAEIMTESFVRKAHAQRVRTLRLIVGKGLHSQGESVLPDVVEDKIVRLKKERVVLTYKWEKRLKTKSGSMIVYLADDAY